MLAYPGTTPICRVEDNFAIAGGPTVQRIEKEDRVQTACDCTRLLKPIVSGVGRMKDEAVIPDRPPLDGRSHRDRQNIVCAGEFLLVPAGAPCGRMENGSILADRPTERSIDELHMEKVVPLGQGRLPVPLGE